MTTEWVGDEYYDGDVLRGWLEPTGCEPTMYAAVFIDNGGIRVHSLGIWYAPESARLWVESCLAAVSHE